MVIHCATRGAAFLHGVALAEHGGRLYCSWASGPVDESSTDETLVCSTSDDDDVSWSVPTAIGPGYPDERNHSHCSFLSHDGQPWAFAVRFLKLQTQDKVFPGLRAEGFLLDEDSRAWKTVGIVAQNFWPYEEPKQMPNGHWIMGGQDDDSNAVIAVSDGDFRKWERIPIPTRDGVEPAGWRLQALRRTALRRPAVSSVQRGTADKRSSLLIATSVPGEQELSHVWCVQYGYPPEPRFQGYGKSRRWSYPYAIPGLTDAFAYVRTVPQDAPGGASNSPASTGTRSLWSIRPSTRPTGSSRPIGDSSTSRLSCTGGNSFQWTRERRAVLEGRTRVRFHPD